MKYSFLLLFVAASCSPKLQPSESKETPNVVLIVVDDLGWKDLAFMGSEYYETPNLDKLAKEGLVFNNAYASAANCAPSRACMISGLQSPRHGVYTVSPSDRGNPKSRKLIPIKNTKHLSDDQYTMMDMFKDEGYVTGSFGKWHVGDNPLNQGVDVNVGGNGRGNPGKNGYFSPYVIANIENGPDGEYLTDRLTTEAINFMNENTANPFFLYMPFYTVHTPIIAKKELSDYFKDKEGSNGQSNPEYAAMVYSMDQNVGRLLDNLEKLELDKNTIVVFTSDNGGIRAISSQEPLRAGKGSYYEGGIRVPMLVRWPNKIKAGSRSGISVSNLDFFPTFKSMLKFSSGPDNLDGNDISALFFGKEIGERDLFWHFPIYLQAYSKKLDDGRDPLFRTRPGTVIISGEWKLHYYYEDKAMELYNLENDSGERNNLALVKSEKVMELFYKMEAWKVRMNAPEPVELNPDYDSEFERKLIDEVGLE